MAYLTIADLDWNPKKQYSKEELAALVKQMDPRDSQRRILETGIRATFDKPIHDAYDAAMAEVK